MDKRLASVKGVVIIATRKRGRKKKGKYTPFLLSMLVGVLLLGVLYIAIPSEVDVSEYKTVTETLIHDAKKVSDNKEPLSDNWYVDYLNVRGELNYILESKIRDEDKLEVKSLVVRLDTAYYLLKDR